MIAPLAAITLIQVQTWHLPDEPDLMQTVTISGSASDDAGVEVSIDAGCARSPKAAQQAAVSRRAQWAYVILAPLHGEFMVWIEDPASAKRAEPAEASDDFDSYVNNESGGSTFNVDTFGNRAPY